jgi:hypothetical protein
MNVRGLSFMPKIRVFHSAALCVRCTQYRQQKRFIIKKNSPLKVLINADIVTDILLDRQIPDSQDIDDLFYLIKQKKIMGYLTTKGLEDISYWATINVGRDESHSIIKDLRNDVHICSLNSDILTEATKDTQAENISHAVDRECCSYYGLNAYVIPNKAHFSCKGSSSDSHNKSVTLFALKQLIDYVKYLETCSVTYPSPLKTPLSQPEKVAEASTIQVTKSNQNTKYEEFKTSQDSCLYGSMDKEYSLRGSGI